MLVGDAEEGLTNSHGHHNIPHNASNMDDEKPASLLPEEEILQPSGSGEKSVLQAKLTNLAIQIGYAGNLIQF